MIYRPHKRNEIGTVLLNMIHKTEGKIPAIGLETTVVDWIISVTARG
jgi:hypothetical protein